MAYTALKHLHMMVATISILLFVLRGYGKLTDAAWMQRKWLRIAPHVNDTILLSAAVAMAVGWWGMQPWIVAKIAALLVYIALGFVVMRLGRTKGQCLAAFAAALCVYGFIVSVAITKSPTGFF